MHHRITSLPNCNYLNRQSEWTTISPITALLHAFLPLLLLGWVTKLNLHPPLQFRGPNVKNDKSFFRRIYHSVSCSSSTTFTATNITPPTPLPPSHNSIYNKPPPIQSPFNLLIETNFKWAAPPPWVFDNKISPTVITDYSLPGMSYELYSVVVVISDSK